MGLFGSSGDNESNERAKKLVEGAHHDSVTEERLTKLNTNSLIGSRGFKLGDRPIIEYLTDDEQVQYIFFGQKKGVEMENSSIQFPNAENVYGSGTVGLVLCFTDQRIMIIMSEKPGAGEGKPDKDYSFIYSEIPGFETNTGNMKHRITLNIDSEAALREIREYDESAEDSGVESIQANFYISNAYDDGDIHSVKEFLRENTETSQQNTDKIATDTGSEEITKPDKEQDETSADISNNQGFGAQLGDDVRYLDDDEEIKFIIEGKSVEIEGGVDKDRTSSSIGSNMKTVVTDDRVLLIIPQKLKGTDTKTILYDDISGIDLKSGFVVKKMSIQSNTRTYDIHILDKEEAEKAVNYIRKKKKEDRKRATQQPNPDGSQPDPTEQLKNIKELHDQGVLSNEEFEEKKSELMDRI